MIACLDVRANDNGDLVVTKGDQYDVRETDTEGREVRHILMCWTLARSYRLIHLWYTRRASFCVWGACFLSLFCAVGHMGNG